MQMSGVRLNGGFNNDIFLEEEQKVVRISKPGKNKEASQLRRQIQPLTRKLDGSEHILNTYLAIQLMLPMPLIGMNKLLNSLAGLWVKCMLYPNTLRLRVLTARPGQAAILMYLG